VANRTVVDFVDDLDGSAADETVRFALDGHTYEIDLSSANATALRDLLAPYVDAARRTTAAGVPFRRVHVDPDPKVVRAWAAATGVSCPVRGRIPREVVEAFERAHAREGSGALA
jgi:hypothetical protein